MTSLTGASSDPVLTRFPLRHPPPGRSNFRSAEPFTPTPTNRYEPRWRPVGMTDPEFHRRVDESLPALIATARRIACDEDIAADAMQDALLKAWKYRGSFDGRSVLATWLTRIVVHCVRDAIAAHRRRRNRAGGGQDDVLELAAGPATDPVERAIASETDRRVRCEVRRLPDRQREVFTLTVWQNLSPGEVAEIVGTTPQTVHANLHAARRTLRRRMADLDESQPTDPDQTAGAS